MIIWAVTIIHFIPKQCKFFQKKKKKESIFWLFHIGWVTKSLDGNYWLIAASATKRWTSSTSCSKTIITIPETIICKCYKLFRTDTTQSKATTTFSKFTYKTEEKKMKCIYKCIHVWCSSHVKNPNPPSSSGN